MASYLDTHLDDAACVAGHRATGQMVPIARGGELAYLINQRGLDAVPLAEPLPAEDYVVGLELLGFRFQLAVPGDGSPDIVFRREPDDVPPSWGRQELRIAAAFGPGRSQEVIEFLRRREANSFSQIVAQDELASETVRSDTARPPISEAKGIAIAVMAGTVFWCVVRALQAIAK